VNFRVVDKSENKTKHDYFLEMLEAVLAWGLKSARVTGNSGYSCVKNLKVIKNHGLGFMFAIKSNRTVSIEKEIWRHVQKLDVPENGLLAWLKDDGNVKLFRTQLKDQLRHDVVYQPNEEKLTLFGRREVDLEQDMHWQIEPYHRAIKQVCNSEKFQVRGKQATKNHVFAASYGYVQLQRLTATQTLMNGYQIRHELFKNVIASFISEFIIGKESLSPLFSSAVNA
jgi:hypothetical protein